MCERTTDIRSLTPDGAEYIEIVTSNSSVICLHDGLFFNKFGGFILKESYGYPSMDHSVWTSRLLEYNPDETFLSIFRGQLIISDLQKIVLKSISPSNLRILSDESEMGVVQESGYVLSQSSGRSYPYGKDTRLSAQEFDKILQQVDQGQQPAHFYNHTRVRVDPNLAGERLWVGIFDLDLGRDVWDKDAVVIDPKTRQMVAREVLRPLSKSRWEQASEPQTVFQF